MNVYLKSALFAVPLMANQALAELVAESGKPVAGPSLSGVGSGDISLTVLGLAAIVALLFGGSYLMKRLRLVAGAAVKDVSVAGQIPLGVKEKLLVLQVGDEKILVGVSSAAMTTLHRWASPADKSSVVDESVFLRVLQGRKNQKSGGAQ